MKRILLAALVVVLLGTLIFTGCSNAALTSSSAPASTTPTSLAASSAKPSSAADSPEEFFKKNTITLIAPFAAGGGSDFAARLLASYWSDATGGGAMIVKNMDGGGGLVGSNFAAAAKPDGLTLIFGNTTGCAVIPAVFKDPALKFDITKQTWIGSIFDDPNLAVLAKDLPYNTIEDIKKAKGLKFSAVGTAGPATLAAAVVADGLGLQDFRIITGYKGGADQRLALAKKEVDGFAVPIIDVNQAVLNGTAKTPFIILQKERVKLYPDTPTFYELVKATPEQAKLYDATIQLTRSFRALFGPPGIPPEKVKYLRDAFTTITQLAAFKTQAGSFFPVWSTPMNGEELTALINDYSKIDGTQVKALVNKYLAVK